MDHRARAHIAVPGTLRRRYERPHKGVAEQPGLAPAPGRCLVLCIALGGGHERAGSGVRLCARARSADPLFAAHPRVLSGARLWNTLSLGALSRRAVRAAEEAAR